MTATFVQFLLACPVEILRLIVHEYLAKTRNRYALVQTTSSLQVLRKQLNYFCLSEVETKKFALNQRYRNKVLERLAKPERQLSLTFHDLRFTGEAIATGNFIPISVHKLTIAGFRAINFVEGCIQLLPCNLLFTLTMNDLWISFCDSIIDVNSFQHIKHLTLRTCTQVINLESLHRASHSLQSLELADTCQLLTTVDYFRHLKKLTLFGCSELVDISCLDRVEDLTVFKCPKIRNFNISNNGNENLLISYCSGLETVVLHSRRSVTIRNCTNFQSCHLQGTFRQVVISDSPLSTFTTDGCITRLLLRDCGALRELSHVNKVIRLDLEICEEFQKIDDETVHLEELDILQCNLLRSISSIPSLRKLRVDGASYLSVVRDLPNLTSLYLEECKVSLIKDLPVCRQFDLLLEEDVIQQLTILNCPYYKKLK